MEKEKRNILKKMTVLILALVMLAAYMPFGAVYAGSDDLQEIVDGMTLQDKITQCIMVDFRYWNDAEGNKKDMTVLDSDVSEILADYHFGSVILFAENIKDTEGTLDLTKGMQNAVINSGGLPLLIATDQEGGTVARLGSGTALPGNMALAAAGDPSNAEKAGDIIGSELASVGINTTLAPVIDVNSNANNPVIGIRSFGDDANLVGEYGSRYITGLRKHNIIGCAKHFPGHGDTGKDSHSELPAVNKSKEELLSCELLPYKKAIEEGIEMIMTAHIVFPKLDDTGILSEKTGNTESRPATLSYDILTKLLRNELGFSGVVVTDAMNMGAIDKIYSSRQSTLEAFKAGADIVMMPVTGIYEKDAWEDKMDKVIDYVAEAVKNDELKESELDESVMRVLKLKRDRGILDYKETDYTAEKALATVGSSEHRAFERDIAAGAVTVIRNNDGVLPYKASKSSKVLMLAPYANEEAQMVMGLNRAKKAGLVPESAEVKMYNFNKDDYELQGALKDNIDWADLVIICSELYGANDMAYKGWSSKGPKSYTEYCKEKGKKSVIISINNPYDVQLYPAADAVMAAYGWRGSSVNIKSEEVVKKLLSGEIIDDDKAFGPNIIAGVEVIFGVYGASGKLPVNVPEFDKENKVYTDTIVYKRGDGITYDKLDPEQVKPEEAQPEPAQPEVKLKKAGIKSLKAGKKKLTVTMSAAPSDKGGKYFEVAYKVKGSKKWKYTKTKSSKVTIKKLKKGKKYSVKARAYIKVDGKKKYGAWSKTKTSKKIK